MMPPVTTSHRRAPGRSPLKTLGLVLYLILVAVSALIVGVYLFWRFTVKPPEIQQPTAPSQPSVIQPADPSVDDPAQEEPIPVEPAPVRREGVYNFVLLGSDNASGNTDTIIMVSYDIPNQKIGMVSVPRDTAVNRDWSAYPKINSAYGHGADTIKAELENTFGVPIDFYVKISLKAFIALVDALGGVDVYIPIDMNYDDPFQDLHIHYTAGQHHLDGQQAMEVVRFRQNNAEDGGGGYNDEGRAEMQRQVLVNLAKKVLSWNSLTKVNEFLNIFNAYVRTDLKLDEMAYFASQAIQFDLSSGLKQYSLTGRSDSTYKGVSWCYTFKAEDILPVLNEALNPYDQPLDANDLDLPVAEKYYFNY